MPGDASAEEHGMLLVSLEDPSEETTEDPIQKEAALHAEQNRQHVSVVLTEAELRDKLGSRVIGQCQTVGFLIDAQTSRVGVSNGYVDAVGKLCQCHSLKKVNVAVVCGQRMELVSTVMARLNSIKGMQTFVVQLSGASIPKIHQLFDSKSLVIHYPLVPALPFAGGETQSATKRSGFLVLGVFGGSSAMVPTVLPFLKSKAVSLEQSRMRCMSRSCPFRSAVLGWQY